MTMRPLEEHPGDPDDELLNQQDHDPTGDVADHDAIQRLVKELDLSGGTARVFRQPPGGAEYDYVGELPVDGFTLEVVKRGFGGGRYKVKLATARGKFARTVRFSVDARFVGELDKAMQPTPQQPMNDNSQLLTYLIKSAEDANQRAQAQQNTMMTLLVTVMTKSAESQAQMFAAMARGRDPVNVTPQEPMSRLLEVMTPFLLSGRGGGNTSLGEIVEGIKAVKSLAEPEAKEEKEEDMLKKVVEVGAPLLGAIFARRGPAPGPAPVENPRQVPASPDDEQRARMQARVRELAGQLRMVTPILVRAAKRNADVASYLEVLDGVLDEEGRDILVEFLKRDDWIATMFGNHPDVVAHAAWFGSLREVILDPGLLDEEEDDASEEDPAKDGPEVQGAPRVV